MPRPTGYAKTGRDYAKLDVLCEDNEKVASLSDRDFRAWVGSILYCHRNLTNGRIPGGVVDRLWRRSGSALIAAGLWEANGNGIVVHDYLDWNDSREDVEARIRSAQQAGQRSAERRAQRFANGSSNGSSSGGFNSALLSSGSSNPQRARASQGSPRAAAQCPGCHQEDGIHAEDCPTLAKGSS